MTEVNKENNDLKKKRSFFHEFLLVFLLIPVLILAIFLVIWWKNFKQPVSSVPVTKIKETNLRVDRQARTLAMDEKGGKIGQKTIVAIAGSETLYGKDLNYELLSHYPMVFDTSSPLPKDTKDSALNQVIDESLILQIAQSKGIIKLEDSFFNNPEKDYRKRVKALDTAQSELAKVAESRITVAGIIIYFNNQSDSKDIPQGAKEKTRQKIEKLRSDILAKKITIRQAGETIAQDVELEAIDPNYKADSLVEYNNINRFIPIKGSENVSLTEAVWKLKKSDVSEILLGYRLNGQTGKSEEAFWGVFEVKDKFEGLSDTFENWFKTEKQKYKIEIKI